MFLYFFFFFHCFVKDLFRVNDPAKETLGDGKGGANGKARSLALLQSNPAVHEMLQEVLGASDASSLQLRFVTPSCV
jgi:hypothetical protein